MSYALLSLAISSTLGFSGHYVSGSLGFAYKFPAKEVPELHAWKYDLLVHLQHIWSTNVCSSLLP